jgi:hypothetical protein
VRAQDFSSKSSFWHTGDIFEESKNLNGDFSSFVGSPRRLRITFVVICWNLQSHLETLKKPPRTFFVLKVGSLAISVVVAFKTE